MTACTFFGHRICPSEIRPSLIYVIKELIITNDVTLFYVGNHGEFDRIVLSVLKELKGAYPYIEYYTVLAYLSPSSQACNFENSIFPCGIETVHPKAAIIWRNKWMLERSDFVVTYVVNNFGGAAKFEKLAEKNNKTIIRLSTMMSKN